MKKLFALAVLFGAMQLSAVDNFRRPSPLQMEWQRMERIAFIHFSINTFTDMEWGYGNESPALFNPSDLDCDQWVKTLKEAGMKGIILTAKHHDGFCLWPSKYTEYSVKSSPWKGGDGDVVREFSDACRKHGVKFGLYLSPWDCNHPEYSKPEYITYFRNQLRELLTEYGDVFEIWFDGANGGRGYYGTDKLHDRSIAPGYYAWSEVVKMTRELQPNCIIHGGGVADIRWVGNEEGYANETHWSTFLPESQFPKQPEKTRQFNVGHQEGPLWMPSETDVSIRPGWYYHDSENHQIKTVAQLMDIYYKSIGRNSVLLLNVPPDKNGRIYSVDSTRLLEWNMQIERELRTNLISRITPVKRTVTPPSRSFGEGASVWQMTIDIDLGKEQPFNRLMLQEEIEQGQRVEAFTVEFLYDGQWKELDKQTTIGYKRILRYPETIASKLRITLKAKGEPFISNIALYNAAVILESPIIYRDAKGMVSIKSSDPHAAIYYTIDGALPTKKSGKIFEKSFLADGKAVIQAVAYSSSNNTSSVAGRSFTFSKSAWRVVGDEQAPAIVFDNQNRRTWRSKADRKEIVVDFGKAQIVQSCRYTPDQARWPQGIAEQYEVFVSNDGNQWTAVAKGEFSNIQNNPIEQIIKFTKPVAARFVKFFATQTIGKSNVLGVSELDFDFK